MATNPFDFTNSTQVNKGIVASNMAVPQVNPSATQFAQTSTTQPTVSATNANVAQTSTGAYDPYANNVKGVQQASTYNPATATATDWSIEKDQTVAGQLEGILSSNNPLLQRAQTKAKQEMNSRGLLNSSMAIGAGESALYDAALPIAQADASTFATAGKYRADVANNMSQYNTTARNNAAQYNAGATQQASKDNAAASNALQSQLFQTKAQIDTANTDAANKAYLQDAQQSLQAQLANQENATKVALSNTDAANKAYTQDSQQSLQAQLANQENATKVSMQQYDAAVKVAMQDADAQNKLQLQQLDAVTRQTLMDTEAKYKNQMQANQSIAQTYQSMIDSFTKIIQDKDLDGDSKANILDQLGAMYDANLGTLARMGDLKLDLNFSYGETGSGAISGVTRTASKDATAPSQSLPSGASPQDVSRWQDKLVNMPNPPDVNGRTKDADGGVTTWYKDGRTVVKKPDGYKHFMDTQGNGLVIPAAGNVKFKVAGDTKWIEVGRSQIEALRYFFSFDELAPPEFWS